MSLKSLTVGSVKPLHNIGELILYSSRVCPYAQRARLVLIAKDIPHQTYNIHLKEKPEWFKTLVPTDSTAKVPIIEYKSKIMYESLIISEYVDEAFPGRKVQSDSPADRAMDKLLVQHLSNHMVRHFQRILFKVVEPNTGLDEVNSTLDYFENEIKTRSTSFFGGSEPGMVDFMIWPFFERIPAYETLTSNFKFSAEQFPKLSTWINLMMENNAVKETFLKPEHHIEFIQSVSNGNNNYDVGL